MTSSPCQNNRRGGLECKSEVPYVIYSGKRTAVDAPQNAFLRYKTGERRGIAVFLCGNRQFLEQQSRPDKGSRCQSELHPAITTYGGHSLPK